MNNEKRRAIFERLRERDPHPDTELEYATPFQLLVAVILSAQASDIGVNKATARLFPVANTPRGFLDLGVDGLSGYIRTIGLYYSKAKKFIETCRILLEEHGGKLAKLHGAVGWGELREHGPAKAWCGLLARVAGLAPDARPVAPRDLVDAFDWSHVRRDDVVLKWTGEALVVGASVRAATTPARS